MRDKKCATMDVDPVRRAEVATLPTDYVAGTGMHAQIMTLFRRHSRAVQVESV